MTLPLPDDRDYTFYLSASHIEKTDPFGEWEHGYKATLHTLLVNKRGVRFVQPIEGCFDGIQPAFSAACSALVYLGINMICAMLIGFADEYDHSRTPLICLSVFHLSIMEDAIDMDYINSPASHKVQNFLTVNAKSRHIYSMVDYLNFCRIGDDYYSFLTDIREFLWMESKDPPLFPVSKRPKLF
ncbi:uncharacterized protein LOC127744838 isoform X1 [Arachis duranensis]|uniref:Uncharacterized protein LOC127744838 isoform X1 n=1 Tax=Arachis duranensis TaxID=130453 RepID=A0A9C6TG27_ARADU|nr:uncharacterized protein LOC127744838 isoform X1 [Arachis duranensis]